MEVNQDMEMEVDEDSQVSTKEMLVYLEFDNKIKDYLFDNKIFFRMARLDGAPLIQLNSHIFKGEYRSCVGSNIFFSDCENTEPDTIFRGGTALKLKHQATQFKLINLKPVKIPSDMTELPQPLHDIKIKKYDYKTLLKKFADGSLDLKEDLAIVPRETSTDEADMLEKKQRAKENKQERKTEYKTELVAKKLPAKAGSAVKTSSKEKSQDGGPKPGTTIKKQKQAEVVDILTFKHEKLRRLAMRPTKRRKEPETVAECDEKYKEAYAYNSLKCTIIKPSDYFRTISETFNEKTLVGAVDIDRSVLQGVISHSPKYYRILSEEEKSALMSIKNFENLSMAARYMVIKSHLDHLESTLPTLSKEEIFKRDNHGRTIGETIKIYKRLLRVLGGLVKKNYCYDSDVDENT